MVLASTPVSSDRCSPKSSHRPMRPASSEPGDRAEQPPRGGSASRNVAARRCFRPAAGGVPRSRSSRRWGARSSSPWRAAADPRARPPLRRAVAAGSTYTLMQMNLCLSGLAGCYGKVAYPAVVNEAIARIREAHPDAVTFNEACSGDVALIARRTGYHLRFSRVIYYGKPLPCVDPGGRGLFGDAVLTRAAIQSTDSQAFEAQAGPERRRVAVRRHPSRRRRVHRPPCLPRAALRWPRTTRSAPSSGRSLHVARPPAPSSSGATSTVAPPAPPRLLDPHRRFRPPGSRESARLRNRRASLALGAGGAGHAHRPRRPAGPRAAHRTTMMGSA